MPESAKEGDSVLPEGSDIDLGPSGREFESPISDHMNTTRISNFFAEIRVVSYAENLDLLGFSAFLYFHAVFVK